MRRFFGRKIKLRNSPTLGLDTYYAPSYAPEACAISGNGAWMSLTRVANNTVGVYRFPSNFSSNVWSNSPTILTAYSNAYGANHVWSYSGNRFAAVNKVSGGIAVDVWTNSNGVFTLEQTLQHPNIPGTVYFSNSVALSMSNNGDVLVVGQPDATIDLSGTLYGAMGAVVVWRRSGTTWTQDPIIVGQTFASNANFGYETTISGNGTTISIGSKESYPYKVYTYTYSGGYWNDAGRGVLDGGLDRDGSAYTSFGSSLSLNYNGTVLAVGAPEWDTYTGAGNNDVGAVFKYYLNGGVWDGANTNTAYILNRTNNLLLPANSKFGGTVRVNNAGNIISVVSTNKVFAYKNLSLENQLSTGTNSATKMAMSKNARRIIVPSTNNVGGTTFFRR